MNSELHIKNAVERLLKVASVDSGYLQGKKVVLEQLQKRAQQDTERHAELFINNAKMAVADLIRNTMPFEIPKDYIYFLEYYGGACIARDSHYFQILGIGPMVEDWYAAIDSDATILKSEEKRLLTIGSLSFAEGKFQFQRANFFLDLAGIVQKDSVIGIGPWGKENPTPLDVINDLSTYANMWKIIADSFAAWLEQAADTQGLFIYT